MKYEFEKVKDKGLVIQPISSDHRVKPVDDSIRVSSKIRLVDDLIRVKSRIRPVTENTIREAIR